MKEVFLVIALVVSVCGVWAISYLTRRRRIATRPARTGPTISEIFVTEQPRTVVRPGLSRAAE